MRLNKRLFTIGFTLGFQDVKQAYRRSVAGPFWITMGMGAQILSIGLVFGLIFKVDLENYLPFLATGIIIWGFMSTSINEGCTAFISSEQIIKQLNLPHIIYILRAVWRNLVTFAHNLIILPIVFIFFWKFPKVTIFGVIPGLILLILNLSWLIWTLGILSTRFRDLPPIVSSLSAIAFYVTPVMWFPKLIENNQLAHLLLGLNPFYHWLQIVRMPIMGDWPTWENWGIASLTAGIGWAVTIVAQNRFKYKIVYWL